MTGSLAAATLVYSHFEHGDTEFLLSDWGSSRLVYRIDGVVYKVPRNMHEFGIENKLEFDNALDMRDRLPSGVFLPAMSLYVVNGVDILAMEFIRGLETGACMDTWLGLECSHNSLDACLPHRTVRELEDCGWRDTTYGNAIRNGTGLYLIDLA